MVRLCLFNSSFSSSCATSIVRESVSDITFFSYYYCYLLLFFLLLLNSNTKPLSQLGHVMCFLFYAEMK